MNLLLINATDPNIEISEGHTLGLAYIASYLRVKFKDIHIKIIAGDIENEINAFNPDLVGISSVSQNFNIAKKIALLCKNKKVPVIIGGYHISNLPSSLSAEMDIGIIGEGEETMLEVIRRFDKFGMDLDKFRDVKGTFFRDEKGRLNFAEPRELINPLDRIPFPARDLLNIKKGRSICLFSSRGCPYNCIFCSSTRFWKEVRYFSAEYVVRELEMLIDEYDIKSIEFSDDLFIGSRKRLQKIVNLIKSKGLNKKITFSFSCRPNLVDAELVKLLKEINVNLTWMGLESGSDKTLSYLKGGNVTVAQNRNAVRLLTEAGIETNASFIIGAPYETREEVLMTLDFIKKSKISQFDVYTLIPLPGTPLWEYAIERGLVSDKMDWSCLGVSIDPAKRIIMSEEISRSEMQKLLGLFEKERKKRRMLHRWKRRLPYMIKKGFKEPTKTLSFLLKKLA